MSEFFCTKETHVRLRQLCLGQSPSQQYGSELCSHPQTFHPGSKHCMWKSHCLLWLWSHTGRRAVGRGDMLRVWRYSVGWDHNIANFSIKFLELSLCFFPSYLVPKPGGLIPKFLLSHWYEISFFFSSPQQWKKEEWFTHEKKKMFKSSLLFAIWVLSHYTWHCPHSLYA